MPWDMPTSSAAIFPKSDSDRLENEENYYVWSIRMKNAFESCEMWEVVNGSETTPPEDVFHSDNRRIWKKKDTMAKAMITQCVKADLVIKVAHATTSNESWKIFESEFSQTGSGSIMLWFRRLTKQLAPGGDVSAHVTGFQEAIRYLANAEFEIPGYVAAAILLSTLPSDPQDPQSWNTHVAGVKIDKNSTTVSSVINGILEEKRRLTEDDKSDSQKQETALAALESSARARGKLFCQNPNCKREGHTIHDCWATGGGKEGQGPNRKKHTARGKKKGKERAHHTKDGGGGGSDSDDEGSHHVKFKKCLMASVAEFSDYSQSDSNSNTSRHPSQVEDATYSARMT